MYDEIHADKSKIKVGIFTETPFLEVSASVKRAIEITRKALEKQGYQVVDFKIEPEEFHSAKEYLIAMVANDTALALSEDFNKAGENLTLGVWTNMLLLTAGPTLRKFIRCMLRLLKMGRQADSTGNLRRIDPPKYNNLMKDRYQFCYDFS